ncbi:YutD family protein [Salipaludibacillus daqingensis]|uniref:YutD family protein n=1 Tax=Salipaludibacillus daqingensis TaxID=3041001 RepID=UPI0024754D61|nr:YutD family protein [Salipaludibacillus daqingensis]
MIEVQGHTYELVEEVREGWSEEAFKERYSDVLNKYDYIVGDWGYEQLRLKGFFEETNRKSAADAKINYLSEYLYEYCNFGCAYFVIKKVKEEAVKSS